MTQIAIFTLVYTCFAIFDLYPLKNEKKSFWVYAGIFGFSYILCIFVSLGVMLPSPAVPIQKVIYFIMGKD